MFFYGLYISISLHNSDQVIHRKYKSVRLGSGFEIKEVKKMCYNTHVSSTSENTDQKLQNNRLKN